MDELVKRLVLDDGGINQKGEAVESRLYAEHCRHFKRRAERLDPSFFPGREKSQDATQSLANGAFASFSKESLYASGPAFHHAVYSEFHPVTGFLYYWRDSATIRFLRSEGSELLRARTNIMRVVRDQLAAGFEQLGTRAGQAVWRIPGERVSGLGPPHDLESITVPAGLRGVALIRAVLDQADTAMTRAEIAFVIERSRGFLKEVGAAPGHEPIDGNQPTEMTLEAMHRRFAEFWKTVDEAQRALLVARGYTKPGGARVSFRVVAQTLGGSSEETCRRMERKLLDRIRTRFHADELAEAVALLVSALESWSQP